LLFVSRLPQDEAGCKNVSIFTAEFSAKLLNFQRSGQFILEMQAECETPNIIMKTAIRSYNCIMIVLHIWVLRRFAAATTDQPVLAACRTFPKPLKTARCPSSTTATQLVAGAGNKTQRPRDR
jgi:hypothetical protein